MKLNPDMLKLSYWPTTNRGKLWFPSDAEVDRLLEINGIEEVGSCGAGANHIIVKFDSIEDMQTNRARIESAILAVIENPKAKTERGWQSR